MEDIIMAMLKDASTKDFGQTEVGKSRELYLDTVAQEALERSGKCPHLKGTVLEILYRDKLNMDIGNRLAGNTTRLTKNTKSIGPDLVTLNDGKVVGRYQLKDSTSSGGISQLGKRLKNGQYRMDTLAGTVETKAKYDSVNPSTKLMQSTGISSETTARVADNAGVNAPGNSLAANLRDAGRQTVNAVGIATAATAIIVAAQSAYAWRKGSITGADALKNVATTTARSSATTGVQNGTALALKEGGKMIAKKTGSESLRRVVGSASGTAVVFSLAEQAVNTVQLVRGKINKAEYGSKTLQNAGGTGGALAGMKCGAIIGTAIAPGVGTAIGSGVGALVGGLGGRFGVKKLLKRFC
ncbi:hypothetical protein [Desulfolutivibrio sulfoxidireducens]|uniref:hypothetical protein n=1 Tax=Desulfolutivibrio sulfoxidireducens TaxID=2773299 RepID=UPI001C401251|nr:hypothetical protein [Desulfolutivibrio sulfoxidireducens]QLA19335.1 hypothetical protein GD604_06015 [Desulfolutivibrio sulfoxidireducens]